MNDLWQITLHELRRVLGPGHFPAYLDAAELRALDEAGLTLATTDEAASILFPRNLQPLVEQCVERIAGRPLRVELVFEPRNGAQASLFEDADVVSDARPARAVLPRRAKASAEPSLEARLSAAGLSATMRFDDFVVGDCNRFAFAAAQAVVEKPGMVYNPLFLYGGVGLGKTHLMNAIGVAALKARPELRVRYLSAETFANEFHASLASRRMDDFRQRNRFDVDLLLVDDIQLIARMEKAQDEFFHTFNTLTQAGKQIVVTSDRIPEELHELQERLQSRLAMGLMCDLQPPDQATRRAILERRAQTMGVSVPGPILDYIAEQMRANVRQLQGALHRVCSWAQLQGVALTLDVAKAQLPRAAAESRPRVTCDDVVRVTCEHFGVTVRDIKGRKRIARHSEPRKVAMYLARKLTGTSYPELGAWFERDHTTILSAVSAIEGALRKQDPLVARIEAIERRLIGA